MRETKKGEISLTFNVNKKINDDFKAEGMKFFIKKRKVDSYSIANFLKLCIIIVEKEFIKLYGKIEEPKEEDIVFYQKSGRINNSVLRKFEHINLEHMYVDYLNDFYDRFFSLMHTRFINEYKSESLPRYSISLFFYDFWKVAKENLSETQIEDLEKILSINAEK